MLPAASWGSKGGLKILGRYVCGFFGFQGLGRDLSFLKEFRKGSILVRQGS